jgi:predicted RNase H-like HicB family nuclease
MPPIYYPAVIDRSASGFGVSFPDLPGCVAAGTTVQEAAVEAEAALALHLDGMRADRDGIPPPSSLDVIEPIEGADDVARLLVRTEMPGKFTRIQATIEDSVLAAIDAVASNRSAFLTEAARAALYARQASQEPAGT